MVRKMVATCFSLALPLLAAAATEAQQIVLVSPAQPTSSDAVTVLLTVPNCGYRVAITIQGDTVYLTPDSSQPCPPLAPPVTSPTFGPLAPGSYTIVVKTMTGQVTDSRGIFVQQPTTQLSLLLTRFSVSATWSLVEGQSSVTAQAVQVSDGSGYFWFFDKSLVEIAVKIVNGSEVNAHFWLFVSSLTDVPFTLSVTDTSQCSPANLPACPTRTYKSMPGMNQNFIDLTAFRSP